MVAIVLVEAWCAWPWWRLFRRVSTDTGWWAALVAPLLAFLGLILGLYLLISRFGLLAGTVAEGVDPTTQTFGLSATGWILVGTPFVALALGCGIGLARRRSENADAIADLVG